jgi:alpha-tubulin suppressor-like RCC1 family protein
MKEQRMRGRRCGPVVLVAVLVGLAVAAPVAPATVYTTPSPAGSFTQVGVGRANVCALKPDATIFCWGANQYGQSTPPGGSFTALSVGDEHACAIRADQRLACWGYSGSGLTTAPGRELHLAQHRL